MIQNPPTHLPTNQIITGDAIAEMKKLQDASIDLILCDLPYGTTNCEWDVCLPMDELWEQIKRVIKPNAAVLLFAQQPFATKLINAADGQDDQVSRRQGRRGATGRMFRYQIVWEKAKALGFLNANRMPLRAHELILVFYNRLPTYNPQMMQGKPYVSKDKRKQHTALYSRYTPKTTVNKGWRYPRDVIRFDQPTTSEGQYHPTQKPLKLLEYLIKTYSNEPVYDSFASIYSADTVLDMTCGAGSTCVACINTGRNYIGIEQNEDFAEVGRIRCAAAQKRKCEK